MGAGIQAATKLSHRRYLWKLQQGQIDRNTE